MNKQLRFATLSKYPPYRSGHAKQALWNNSALAALTGAEQHQVTYCGASADPEDDAGPGVQVHHVKEVRGNRRVPDGHLLHAVAAELYRVALDSHIDVINTYYIDPHATLANRAADALGLIGRRPIVIHSIEGSDVLDSVCEHLGDGSAALLFGDVLRADVLCTVSDYTARQFLAGAETIGGARLADSLAATIALRYPGLPPAAFARPSADTLAELRAAQKAIEERERQKRRDIMARAQFSTQVVNPFDCLDITVTREPGWFKGKKPTQRMAEMLQKNGVDTAELSFWEAKSLISKIIERRDKGMCSYKQAKILSVERHLARL